MTSRPVVVGVDGSAGAEEALRVALAEARLRGAPLRAVHVWRVPEAAFLAGFAPSEEELAAFETAARELLAEAVGHAVGEAGDVPVELVLREAESPAAALLAESETAALLVVGSRGLGGLRELVLGSVSHACCRHARCPVLVVPPPERLRQEPSAGAPPGSAKV